MESDDGRRHVVRLGVHGVRGATSAGTGSTGDGRNRGRSLGPGGPNYSVCETDSKLDELADRVRRRTLVQLRTRVIRAASDAERRRGAARHLSFGNAIGNLDCGGDLFPSEDGDVKVTRLDNTDGERRASSSRRT